MFGLQKYATSPSAFIVDESHASSGSSIFGVGQYTNCSEYNEEIDEIMEAERYGQTLAAQYDIVEIIGSGSFGVVYKAYVEII